MVPAIDIITRIFFKIFINMPLGMPPQSLYFRVLGNPKSVTRIPRRSIFHRSDVNFFRVPGKQTSIARYVITAIRWRQSMDIVWIPANRLQE